MRKSKPCKNRVPMYEDNPDRRVHCPEWSLHICHYEKLSDIAHKHDMSRSRVFETIMQNFFLIEKPTIAIEEAPAPAPKKTLRKLTLHPSVIEAIQTFSAKSCTNSSRYINEALAVYFNKYNGEVDLKKLIKFM